MMRRRPIMRDRSGSAAVEMALVTPLLLVILFGSVEVGNFFYNEHLLTKAVRDGARYAGRQNFSYYRNSGGACASPTDATMIANVKTLVRTSLLSGGTNRLGGWTDGMISLTATCHLTAVDASSATQNMEGIYRTQNNPLGAAVVTVSATVPYRPIVGTAFGFSGSGINLNATQRAAVTGL